MEEPLRAELFFPPVGRAVLLIWKTFALNPRAASNEMFNHEGAVDDDEVPTVDDPEGFGTCSDDCKVKCC